MKSKRYIWLAAAALVVTGGTSIELLAQNQQRPSNEQRQPRQNANAQRPGGPGAPGAPGAMMGRGLEQLNLTEQQKQKIAQIREKYRVQLQQVRDSNQTPEQKRERTRKLMEAQHKEVQAVLTPEQKKKLEEWQKNRPAPGTPGVGQRPGAGQQRPGAGQPRPGTNRPAGQGQRPAQGQSRSQSGSSSK